MTKPVTDHPNCVRKVIRKTVRKNIWKLILCRHLYKKNIQNICVLWFSFFACILCYTLFTGMYLLGKVNRDHNEDKGAIVLLTILVISSTYICVVCMALEVVIMLIIMIFMTISIFFCFLCVFFCPRCLAWRPNRDNDRIDRHYFLGIINGNGSWEHVLQYIYKYKRRHFKKDRYKWFFEGEKIAEESKGDKSDLNLDHSKKLNPPKEESSEIDERSKNPDSPNIESEKKANLVNKSLLQKKGKKSKKIKNESPEDSSILCTICQLDFEEGELT